MYYAIVVNVVNRIMNPDVKDATLGSKLYLRSKGTMYEPPNYKY
jgi:hypothetical protein